MLKNINIGSKITGLVLAVVLLTVLAISFIAYDFSKTYIEDRYYENLQVIADLKVEKIESFFSESFSEATLIQNLEAVQQNLSLNGTYELMSSDSVASLVKKELDGLLLPVKNANRISDIYITNLNGYVLYTSNESRQGYGQPFNDPDLRTIAAGEQGMYLSKNFNKDNKPFMLLSAPLTNSNNDLAGVLVLQLDITPVLKATQQPTGMGETGEILLARKDEDNKIIFLNNSKKDSILTLNNELFIGNNKALAVQQAVQGKEGMAGSVDYHNENTIAVWKFIPKAKWGFVAKIDSDEIAANGKGLFLKFLITGAIVIILSMIVAIVFSRFLTFPLISLKATLQMLSQGALPAKVEKSSNDEIGQMAETTGELVQALKRTAGFAHKIGEGDFDADFKPMSDKDTLGTALLTMRDSIQEAEKKDKERNWIVTGVAEIGEILRTHNELEPLGDAVIAYITNKINAIQGAFYVVNDDDRENVFIEMKSSYAYHKKKHLKASYKFAEGLVGQSAIEQDTLLRTEIPGDYVTVTSGLLGDQKPNCILIVPLITNEKVYGVVEFAGFEKFNPGQVKFVQEISLITARTVFNIKVNERTRRLLSESQKMSQELQQQQEVLQQNAEEMEATQEELKRANNQLEEQVEEVNRTQKRMQLLLENASEVITIYEEDGSVRYISPSVEKIIGYSQNELIGHRDIDYVQEQHKDVVEKMFSDLLENPEEPVTVQFVYQRKDGDTIWLEATGNNLLNDPAIQGIIVNSRDITERRRAEQEERMRSQMQALSENSPDLITRMNNDGDVFYINPIIENYTGNKPDRFLKQNIGQVDLPDTIVSQWMNILKEVSDSNEKLTTEMEFPSVMGDRIMQVNAIPEYNGHGEDKVASVLVVSHDITSRKLIELEIQTKNKKITESINYAKRIQGAILPNNKVIHQVLPESFILYKAKDVVSGDFPWFMQVGDDIYIAAVDCTGHGVPGALISLIGYFLLNDIVRSRKISDPGQILDLLDEGVTQTLRQDKDDSKTKDGMDIALCKINKKKGEIEYAGAHRPLYYVKNGALEEIKGNKFPIGGGKYRNQTNFTNTIISVEKNDAVYFCSDGFPDQFGGPDNRKFGPKRLRDLIVENHALPMSEIYRTCDNAWEDWKGEYKQTDDVLLIGIRF